MQAKYPYTFFQVQHLKSPHTGKPRPFPGVSCRVCRQLTVLRSLLSLQAAQGLPPPAAAYTSCQTRERHYRIFQVSSFLNLKPFVYLPPEGAFLSLLQGMFQEEMTIHRLPSRNLPFPFDLSTQTEKIDLNKFPHCSGFLHRT